MSGKRKRKARAPARIRPVTDFCPHLTNFNHKIASPPTYRYNCVAWAAGDATRKWGDQVPYYWPKEVERGSDIAALIRLFNWLGFEQCGDGRFEAGFEKVAIYSVDGLWTHAARQKSDGTWTSKLGDFEDIDHENAEVVVGGDYGEIAVILKRPARE